MFKILGVFPGSFTLEAAEGVLATVAPGISDPLGALIRLVDVSLVERLDRSDDESKVTTLFVVEDEKPLGIIHLHDLLRIGVA